jgi:hypothetical protein
VIDLNSELDDGLGGKRPATEVSAGGDQDEDGDIPRPKRRRRTADSIVKISS